MFASGNFCNFPIDDNDDVSIGSAGDLIHGSMSSICLSDCDSCSSLSRGTSTDSLTICAHERSCGCLDEIPDDQPIENVRAKNIPDLCDSLRVILSIRDLCDVTFLVGPALQPIYGLKAVMSTRSRVLHSLFLKHHVFHKPTSTMSPKKKKPVSCFPKFFNRKKGHNKNPKPHIVISLPEHDPVCFGAFVTYLHTGSVSINVRNLIGLLHLTEVYQVDRLPAACWAFAERNVTPQTAIRLLVSAQKYATSEVVSRLVKNLRGFIDKNASRIVANKKFSQLPPAIASAILTRPNLVLPENKRVDAILSRTKHNHGSDATDGAPTMANLLDFSSVMNEYTRDDVIAIRYIPPMSVDHETLSSSNHFVNDQLEHFSMKKRLRKQSTATSTKSSRSSYGSSCESGFDSSS